MASKGGRKRQSKRVNLWPRRIITGTGLLLILALLVWGIWAAGVAIINLVKDSTTPQEPQSAAVQGDKVTPDGIVDADGVITVPDCDIRSLTVQPTVSGATVGSGTTITLDFNNHGQTACLTSMDSYAVVIGSGEDVYFDGTTCDTSENSPTPLLIRPGNTWSGTLRWNGMRHDGCTQVAVDGEPVAAQPGAYWAQVYSGSAPIGSQMHFDIH